MCPSAQMIVSASRRTDIPAFYLEWFMDGVDRGYFEVQNPFNRKLFSVPSDPEKVHTFVFWSKNYGPFLKQRIGEKLIERGFNLWFHFTINSEDVVLEPRIPPLDDRLAQLTELTRRFDPRAVVWRFDPLCFYLTQNGQPCDNLSDFSKIAHCAAECGLTDCITSFLDAYPKIRKRTAVRFRSLPISTKVDRLMNMKAVLAPLGIDLDICCEKDVMAALPNDCGIQPGACISGSRLMDLYEGTLNTRLDNGQRILKGCGCSVSRDIGSYNLHPCHHDCLYCYANPSCDHPGGRR